MRLKRNKNHRGSLIALYGPNNLGKSTQLVKIISKLCELGHQSFMVVKYPIYELYPTGPKLNTILRKNKKTNIDVKSIEMQKLYAQNRYDFQPAVIELLNDGIDVICEDYVGTGIAWGRTWDLPLNDLENLNYGLIRPDYEILIDGKRFAQAIERGHAYEDAGDTIWQKNRKEFLYLADRYNWNIVNGNQTIQKVHKDIWKLISPAFKLRYKEINSSKQKNKK